MVWLHGGNNVVGSGAQSDYSGVSLTARGVVLVTTNYRLGALGFFSHPELELQPVSQLVNKEESVKHVGE